MLTLKQASEQTGKTKQAIQQAIKKGRLSASKNDFNNWVIDPSELFRVYAPIHKVDINKLLEIDSRLHGVSTTDLHLKVKELEIENRLKDEKVDFYSDQIRKIEVDRDNWREQANKLLLSAPIVTGKTENKTIGLKIATTTLIVVVVVTTCFIAYFTYSTFF